MPYKDEGKQREYQRNWQRQQRAAGVKSSTSKRLNPEDFITAEALRDLLSETLADVQAWEGDTLQRASTV